MKQYAKNALRTFNPYEYLFLTGVSLFAVYLWLHMFVFDGKDYWAGWKYIRGDWIIHLPYITNFAYRKFPILNQPLLSGEPFRYHYAADLVSGFLLRAGLPLTGAVILPSIIFSILLIFMLYVFYRTILGKPLSAVISFCLFLLTGGMGIFIVLFRTVVFSQGFATDDPVIQLTKLHDAGIWWENIVLAEFLPQRAFLMAFPLALLVLVLLYQVLGSLRNLNRNTAVVIGLITGMMPLVHFQTFFVLILFTAFTFAYSYIRNRRDIRYWVLLFFVTALISVPILTLHFGGLSTSYVRFHLGWLAPANPQGFILFWLGNTGPVLILALIGWRDSPKYLKLFTVPALILFVMANTIIFQESIWDNRKFLIYWFLLVCPLAASGIRRFLSANSTFWVTAGILLFFVSILSGLVDILNLTRFESQKRFFFTSETMETARKIRSVTDENAVFLTAPVTDLGFVLGRQTVMGFDLWLRNFGHGGLAERQKDISRIYSDPENSGSLLRKYRIDYIVIGSSEQHLYQPSNQLYQMFPVAVKSGDTVVFDVRRQ